MKTWNRLYFYAKLAHKNKKIDHLGLSVLFQVEKKEKKKEIVYKKK